MFSLRDADRIRVAKGIQKSMSDPISKVEMALKNCTNDIKLIGIKDCKYLLPCGKCDKTDEMCSQYLEVKLNGDSNNTIKYE